MLLVDTICQRRKNEKVTLPSLSSEIITVWKELFETQESIINPQDLLDTGSLSYVLEL